MVKERALSLGFAKVGIADAEIPSERQAEFRRFLAAGRQGEMSWMTATAERRESPRKLWPDAQSAVVCAMNYGPEHDPMDGLSRPGNGLISAYAGHRDYHDIVKGKLKEVAGLLATRTGQDVKVFVDTAPILEKPLAQRAGIGWQGKHSNLVARDFGSWLFLGEILTSARLKADPPEVDRCGHCRRCLEVCPTDAFPAPYKLDARRCIAYLTIEHPGPIDRQFRQSVGNRIYGCDDCLAVCPWNKFAKTASEAKLQARSENIEPPLADLLKLDDTAFRKRFAGSPIKRIGRNRFLRNVLIAAGNSDDTTSIEPCKRLLSDPSPLVRGGAVWALSRLLPSSPFQAMAKAYRDRETDPSVIEEWEALA